VQGGTFVEVYCLPRKLAARLFSEKVLEMIKSICGLQLALEYDKDYGMSVMFYFWNTHTSWLARVQTWVLRGHIQPSNGKFTAPGIQKSLSS